MFIKILLFHQIIVNFIWNKYFIIIRTNLTALSSNILACDLCKSRLTRYSTLTFLNKTFICSQCDWNYISMLIIFYNQIKSALYRCEFYYTVISTTYWLLNVPVHATHPVANYSRLAVVHRHPCGLGCFAIAASGQRSRCHYGTASRKFVANSSNSVNSNFLMFQ